MYDLTITPHPGRPWVGDHMCYIYIYIYTHYYACMYIYKYASLNIQNVNIHHDIGIATTIPSTYVLLLDHDTFPIELSLWMLEGHDA